MLDLVLAYVHHLAAFALVGLLFAQFALVRPGLDGARLGQIAGIDMAYGTAATLLLVAGTLRVFFGAAGLGYYLPNHVFWTKMALFLLMGLVSIGPTLAFRRWRRAAADDPGYLVPDTELGGARRLIHAQLGILVLIPLAAAAMARGFGL